jgi:hypothetical protein
VSTFCVIRPQDDVEAKQASDWCDELITQLTRSGHSNTGDVDKFTPADTTNITVLLRGHAGVICYFGHGDENSWLTNSLVTIDSSNILAATGKPIVSIACKTARNLGPDAITAGITSWLGFSIAVAIIRPHKTRDPIGEAIVTGVARLGKGATMQQARDEIAAQLNQVVADYDAGGKHASHPQSTFGYFAAMSLRDHVVVHGSTACVPLP